MTGAAHENAPRRRRKVPGDLVGWVVGRYQLLAPLAAGGMGSVYVARAVGAGGFERRLAVKVLHQHLAQHEQFVSMFLDEARLAARIHHPNVVPTLDVFEAEDRYVLVMEYVAGVELGALVRASQNAEAHLPVPVVLRIMVDALSGLSAAHALTAKDGSPLRLVHRDVSPQNILVGADGVSRLTDFGVAKAEQRLFVTTGGEFKGKYAYAAPEQLEQSVTEQRSDLFALGVVLWEVLARRRLFAGKDKHAVIRKVLSSRITPLSRVSAELSPLDAVVARALARELDHRTSSAEQMLRELEAAAPAVGGVATQAEVSRWVKRLAGEALGEQEQEVREAEATVAHPSEPSTPRGPEATVPEAPPAMLDSVRPPATEPLATPPVGLEADRSTSQVSHMAPLGSTMRSTMGSTVRSEGGQRKGRLWFAAGSVLGVALAVSAAVGLTLVLSGGDPEEPVVPPAPEVAEQAPRPVVEVEAPAAPVVAPAEEEPQAEAAADAGPEARTETEAVTETEGVTDPRRPRWRGPRPGAMTQSTPSPQPASMGMDIPTNPYRNR